MMRIVVIFVATFIIIDARDVYHWATTSSVPRLNDFFGMWSYGLLVVQGHANVLYNQQALLSFMRGLDPSLTGPLSFYYPPTMMLMLAPLGMMSQDFAWFVWTVAGFLALLISAYEPGRANWHLLLFLGVPSATVALLSGQNGLFTGALMLGGLRLMPRRPMIGGILLGLLTTKPQLGILLPVALLATKQWRGIAWASFTAILLAASSVFLFGSESWISWIQQEPEAMGQFRSTDGLIFMSPTVSATMVFLNTANSARAVTQTLAAVFSVIVSWRACRSGIDRHAIVVVMAAAFLATPYSMLYDMQGLSVALLMFSFRGRVTWAQSYAIVFTLLLPVILLKAHFPPAAPIVLIILILALEQDRKLGWQKQTECGPIGRLGLMAAGRS